MYPYQELLRHIYHAGVEKYDRTGVGTYSSFGHQMRFNLLNSFPLLTLKHTPLRLIYHELHWFLSGGTNIKYLNNNSVYIWDEWADENGELGPIYGCQWRRWGNGIDQIEDALYTLRNNPDSRRIIVSAWNVEDIPHMNLPPCHLMFQFNTQPIQLASRVQWFNNNRSGVLDWKVSELDSLEQANAHDYLTDERVPQYYLSCRVDQRSCDMFLGVPFNIASYALLTYLFAHSVGMLPRELIWQGGDCHIYKNHVRQVEKLLSRKPKIAPRLKINSEPKEDPVDYKWKDLELRGYDPHPAIKAPVAV